ncbi:hypothetical protein [Streptomyces sp. NBC_00503]|uniref:hypothetical protein n=1 Tax=Streptomyces sp. NBC_00503 TaxID=2903659 RepID=UPI002E819D4D|nr:hypothetical protein [Streptomyces sp. NBC_00503]WUD83497.1 hypothetical protein OG490_24720 [Streptomyces sp. NBC_00503]
MSAGHATTAAHPARVAALDAVLADRAGPAAVRLLQLTRSDDAFVRREAMELLSSARGRTPWPEAAEAALARLADPDEEVRRRAAFLVVHAGSRDIALRALGELTEPVVRTALADLLGGSVAHLRADPLASVRFLACLDALRLATLEQWAQLDTALLADALEASRHLDGVGWRWGRVLCGMGREDHAYALVARLVADPAARDIGAGLARETCHNLRAAPVVLLPLLVRHCGEGISPAMAEALTTASISEAAMRTHGALIAELPFTPYPRDRRPSGSPRPSYDSATAAAVLQAKPVGIGRLRHAPEIFGALLDAGPLTFRQAAQLYGLTFERPSRMQGVCAPLWLRHAGPTALPRLLALMTPHLGEYGIGEYYSEGLARMGRRAAPALPSLTALIDRRTRIPVNDPSRDGEMMLDEGMLAAAVDARRAILADCG